LIGEVPHAGLEAWYSAADLFLTSSPREGSNYALIESMSCGVIPVCSDIAAHRFIAGEFAPRFPVGDSEACAKAIVSANAIVGPAARAAIRAHFESRLSYAAIARQLGHAYATAVDDNSSAREAM
jgi:glycosyltransferase involved in cell wall biosynthesis